MHVYVIAVFCQGILIYSLFKVYIDASKTRYSELFMILILQWNHS